MLFVVLFEDGPDGVDLRRRHLPDHLAYLERNALKVRAAGPVSASDGQGTGGLWLVEAQNIAEVEALITADPLWPTGLRKSVRILLWTQVFADGRRLRAP